ncbi:MAG: helix-turn-helix domain-containing protein [Oscillospiraceae bacterium]|nr:helix-turn-helix domain-containing protein [Oscillospiraceae bacterium]
MLCERLRQLTNEKGWSLQYLAEISDLPLETVRNIYYGKTPDPKVSTVMKLAKSFNLTVNCLMGQCSHTPQERAILINYRSCGKHGKSIIEHIAKYEAGAMKKEREQEGRHIYTIQSLAATIQRSEMTVKNALKALEQRGLIYRQRQGVGMPNRIYVKVQTDNCPMEETENCLPRGTTFYPHKDRKLSASNNKRNNNRNYTRVYEYEEGESL